MVLLQDCPNCCVGRMQVSAPGLGRIATVGVCEASESVPISKGVVCFSAAFRHTDLPPPIIENYVLNLISCMHINRGQRSNGHVRMPQGARPRLYI